MGISFGNKGPGRRTLLAALFIAAAALAFYSSGRLERASADGSAVPDALAGDPMGGAWKSRVVPKQRLMVSYRRAANDQYAISTFVGTGEKTSDGVVHEHDLSSGFHAAYGRSPSDKVYVFDEDSAEGVIPSTVTITPDFYAQTEFETPKYIHVNSQLLRTGSGDHDGDAELYLQVIEGGDGENDKDEIKLVGITKIDLRNMSIYESARYDVSWYADLSWTHKPEQDRNTAHDIAAYDWDGDGYSDYLVTFLGIKSKGDPGSPRAMLILIDGKDLYDKVTGKTSANPIAYPINGTEGSEFSTRKNVFAGGSDVKVPNSYRMAIGDFDGDGRAEAAICYTKIHGAGANEKRANSLEIYEIDYNPSGVNDLGGSTDMTKGKFYGRRVYTDDNAGESFMQNDSVGIAAGDINGDGRDELVQIYARARAYYTHSTLRMTIYTCDASGSYRRLASCDQLELPNTTYKMTQMERTVSPIHMAMADFDGDGFDELAWIQSDDGDKLVLNLNINDWDVSPELTYSGYGNHYETSLQNLCGWPKMQGSDGSPGIKTALCAGVFDYPSSDGAGVKYGVGVAQMSDSGTSGATDLYYGVVSWSKDGGFTVNAQGSLRGEQSTGSCSPAVAAVDIMRESMILGEPAVVTVEDNVELHFLAQAPPKHWDRVLAEGSGLKADGRDGYVTVDAFSRISNSALVSADGYFTSVSKETGQDYTYAETKVSDGTWGLDFGYELKQRRDLFDAANQLTHRGNNNSTDDDPLLDVGVSHTGEVVNNNTSSYTHSVSFAFSAEADRDDQLYYTMMDYNICRYPVIYPERLRTMPALDNETGKEIYDDDGNQVYMTRYVQYVVPTEKKTVFSSTGGRGLSWYQPMHDGFNLFTYPRELREITGYPQGEQNKDEDDPLKYINGRVYVWGEDQVIGNLDATAYEMSVEGSETTEEEDVQTYTLGGHAYYHPMFGINSRHMFKVDLNGDYSWETASTTTLDTHKGLGAMVNWSGIKADYDGQFTAADMQFTADIAYFTQDDGAFVVGYAIPRIGSGESASGKLWGPRSPYNIHPDPGLILPLRWGNQLQVTDGGTTLTENENEYLRYTLRGLNFTKSGGESASTGEDGRYRLPIRLLERGADYEVSLRVVNYSFVRTKEPVTVGFYWQGIDETSALPLNDVDEIKKLPMLITSDGEDAEIELEGIDGRHGRNGTDNWQDVSFYWNVPEDEEDRLGYVHAVVTSGETQLNTDNDHGYALIGTYDPSIFDLINDYQTASVAASRGASTAAVADSEKPNLSVSNVRAFALNDDGTAGDELKGSDINRYTKMRISATVSYKAGEIAVGDKTVTLDNALLVRMALLASRPGSNRAVLGAQELPLMPDGDSYDFSFDYDPSKTDPNLALTIGASSPVLSRSMQADAGDNAVTLWEAAETGGGGGGCSLGWGALALPALAPLALWRGRR